MATDPHHAQHYTNGRHQAIGGMSWQVLAAVVAVFSAFALVAYNMGKQAARIDQTERDVIRIDKVQEKNEFRLGNLERRIQGK